MRTSSEISPDVTAEIALRFFAETRRLVDERLNQLLPAETIEPQSIHGAIRWSIFRASSGISSILSRNAGNLMENVLIR